MKENEGKILWREHKFRRIEGKTLWREHELWKIEGKLREKYS